MPGKSKWVEWEGTVKTRKTGNQERQNGSWSKGKYLTFSIAIPSEQAKLLNLIPGSMLMIKAAAGKKKKK